MTQAFITNLADKLQKVGALHAIGETWISIDSTIPAGGVPFLGQLVSRSVWADLFAWATAQGKVKTESEWQSYASANGGNCPFYSGGDGSTTFRMPKIVGYIKGAASLDEAGGHTAEGLPNITGTIECEESTAVQFLADGLNSLAFNGSFYHTGTTTRMTIGNGSNNTSIKGFGFDASRSSSIYGNSDHVTPETHSILIGVYAVGIVANIGSADATQFLNGLATLEANLSEKLGQSTAHVVETWRDGASWYRKWSDGWVEQGGRFVVTSSSVSGTAYNTATLTFYRPFNNLVSWHCQSRHDCFISGFATDGGSCASVTVFQKNTQTAAFSNPFVVWYACGY